MLFKLNVPFQTGNISSSTRNASPVTFSPSIETIMMIGGQLVGLTASTPEVAKSIGIIYEGLGARSGYLGHA